MSDNDTVEINVVSLVKARRRNLEIQDTSLESLLNDAITIIETKDFLAVKAIVKAQAGDLSEIRHTAIEALYHWLGGV